MDKQQSVFLYIWIREWIKISLLLFIAFCLLHLFTDVFWPIYVTSVSIRLELFWKWRLSACDELCVCLCVNMQQKIHLDFLGNIRCCFFHIIFLALVSFCLFYQVSQPRRLENYPLTFTFILMAVWLIACKKKKNLTKIWCYSQSNIYIDYI